NSGGPLLDSAGRLIGVNTANLGPFSGIGFAVPVDTINRIVPPLIAHGAIVRPGLGVQIGTDQLSSRLNLAGVVVIEVPPDSAAGRAGLKGTRPGDGGRWILGDVIVGADGQPIGNSSDLYRLLDRHAVGDKMVL